MDELEPAPQQPVVRVLAPVGTALVLLAVAIVAVALLVGRPAAPPGERPSTSASPARQLPTSAAAPSAGSALVPSPRRDDAGQRLGRVAATVVVVDASAGAEGRRLDAERRALATFIEEYGSTELGVVVHGGPARTLVPLGDVAGPLRREAVAAVGGLEAGGPPDLAGALELAREALDGAGAETNRVLVILGATPDPAVTDLDRAVSEVAYHTIAVAVGRGPHEAQLAEVDPGSGAYRLAPDLSDLVERLADVRVWIDGAVLLAFGEAANGRVDVDPETPLVRFTVYDPGRAGAVVVVDPSGRRLDVGSLSDDVAVYDADERVTIAVDRPAAGAWSLEAPDGASRHVEAFASRAWDPAIRAFARGDEGDEVKLGLMGSGLAGDPAHGTAILEGPGGEHLTVPLELFPKGSEEFGMSGATTWAARMPGLSPPGSWLVRFRVSGDRAEGSFGYEFVHAVYVPPRVDSDGDGIRDVVERQLGLDPADPADGDADPDMDGLSNTRELAELGTQPGRFDTDGGGENDGSEVGASRDPLDPADDVRPQSCLARVAEPGGSPAATASPRPTPAVMPRDVQLEATLPDEIAGQPTSKVSIVGPPEWHGFLGGLWGPLVVCAGASGDDLTVAYAVAPAIGNWSVVAVRVRGATGHRLEEIWAHELVPGGEDSLGLHEVTIEGRRVLASDVSWGLYARGDVLYVVINLSFGDFPAPPPVDPPPFEEILRDVISSLPAP